MERKFQTTVTASIDIETYKLFMLAQKNYTLEKGVNLNTNKTMKMLIEKFIKLYGNTPAEISKDSQQIPQV